MVDGIVNPDEYLIDISGHVRADISTSKSQAYDGLGELNSLDQHMWDKPSLSESVARELARIGRDIAQQFGGPQDIEWVIDTHDRIWIVQTRPITTIGRAPLG